MPRALPQRPNLEHLKAQAKDLLDALRRGDAQAFARIRAVVPAFARRSNAEIAQRFALHDAQSAIAREYGCPSWATLRDRVAAASGPPRRLSPELAALLQQALARRGTDNRVPTPPAVPVLPLRNSVVFPGSVVPIDVGRPSSVAALDATAAETPAFIAIFAQRAAETEQPVADDLHPTGTLCVVRKQVPAPDGNRSIVIEGVRWIRLVALERTEPYYVARVADAEPASHDDPDLAAIAQQLRALAHRVADTMANAAEAHALIDHAADPEQLADLVMAHLPTSVDERAAYAEEPFVTRKVERALAALTASSSPGGSA